MKIYGAYNFDSDLLSLETSVSSFLPSRTRQADAIGSDINDIVKEFGLTGQLPTNISFPTYQDFTDAVEDYQTALNVVRDAQDAFLQLPAEVRAKFANDPQKLLQFVSEEKNYAQAKAWGLLVPEAATPATPAATPTNPSNPTP